MSVRILVIGISAGGIYDQPRIEMLGPLVNPDTELVVRSLQGIPKTPFLPTPAVFSNKLFQTIVDAEKEGFDGVVIGCCSDPGLRDAKTLVDIPVTAPFEAVARIAPAIGRLSIIAPLVESGAGENLPGNANWAWKLAHEYNLDRYLASIRLAPADHPSTEDAVRLFREDPLALRRLVLGGMERAVRTTAMEQARKAVVQDEATVLFFSCTLWAGMLGPIAEKVPAVILDPLITPLKYVEALAVASKYYLNKRVSE